MAELAATGDPELDSHKVLEQLWSLGSESVPIPVDPIFIATALGITVLVANLEPGVDGMLVKVPGEPSPTIYLNASTGVKRQRFTCAHELGHWMKRSQGDDWAFVDKRNQLSGLGTDPSERYANRFAAALLMPEAEVARLSDFTSLETLAAHFNVSAQAMGLRVANLWAKRRNG